MPTVKVIPACAWVAQVGSAEIGGAKQRNPGVYEGGIGYTVKNDRVQDASPRMAGRCRHARAVYELAHNLMWLDVA